MNRLFIIALLTLTMAASCKKNENVKVLIETSEGNILLQLYDDTPLHRDNFVKLVKDGYYDGLIFHRVIKDFMIQAGDPNSRNPKPEVHYGNGGPSYTVPAEILPNRYHKKGALAAARTRNPEKKSSGSQFYIVQGKIYDEEYLKELEESKKTEQPEFKFGSEAIKDYLTVGGTPFLDGDYTVFGEVIEGLDVIDKIAATETTSVPPDRPVKDVFIVKAVVK
ncbi:MAG: peptidylprolyl isomerase [Prevotellaceae bacterium]|jgi:peptidyl-prolyl cis-trans isomerase B (cyclophilin B)|nr:peptidylprolyl isomerase [Prevotellaceae bacterium]